jgi:hypothetical protein
MTRGAAQFNGISRHFTTDQTFNGQGKTSPGRSMHAVLHGTSAIQTIQTEHREFCPSGYIPE